MTRTLERRDRLSELGPVGVFALLIGPFLSQLDFFITNVALPTIDRDLTAPAAALELIVAGYGTAYAVLLVLGGRLGDRYGRRRMLLCGLAGFTLMSLLCGLAPNVAFLIIARVLQGAAAALITPQVLATFQAALHGEIRARAIARYAAAGGLASAVGQLVGGLLIQADIAGTGWRPIFLVNVPIGITALIMVRRTVPGTRAPRALGVDGPGTTLLALVLVFLLVPLTEGSTLGWPAWTWAMLAAAPIAAFAFVFVERRTEARGRVPLLPPSLLRIPSVHRGLLAAVPFFMGFGAFMFVFALTVQDGLHADPLRAGLAITPMAVAYFVTSLFTPRLIARFGRRLLTTGMILQTAGLAALILAVAPAWPSVSLLSLAPGLILAGAGQAVAFGTVFRTVLAQVPAESAGVGSGVLVTVQQASLALGVAALGSLFTAQAAHGFGGAFTLVIAIQIAIAIAIAAASPLLPDIGARARGRTSRRAPGAEGVSTDTGTPIPVIVE